jgi:hypothetical protein
MKDRWFLSNHILTGMVGILKVMEGIGTSWGDTDDFKSMTL